MNVLTRIEIPSKTTKIIHNHINITVNELIYLSVRVSKNSRKPLSFNSENGKLNILQNISERKY